MSRIQHLVRALTVSTLLAGVATAAPITLYFTGTTSAGTPTSVAIPNGTPFSGSLTFDPATPNTGAGDAQHRNFSDAGATFEFEIGGLYSFVTNSVGIEVDHNYGLNFGGGDVIWFWANSATIGGSGQSTNPLFVDVTSTVLLWRQDGNGIFSTANTIDQPPMENLGLWDFAGIDLSVLEGSANFERYLLSFSTISDEPPTPNVPEPATFGALGLGLAGIGFAQWKRRRHSLSSLS